MSLTDDDFYCILTRPARVDENTANLLRTTFCHRINVIGPLQTDSIAKRPEKSGGSTRLDDRKSKEVLDKNKFRRREVGTKAIVVVFIRYPDCKRELKASWR